MQTKKVVLIALVWLTGCSNIYWSHFWKHGNWTLVVFMLKC